MTPEPGSKGISCLCCSFYTPLLVENWFLIYSSIGPRDWPFGSTDEDRPALLVNKCPHTCKRISRSPDDFCLLNLRGTRCRQRQRQRQLNNRPPASHRSVTDRRVSPAQEAKWEVRDSFGACHYMVRLLTFWWFFANLILCDRYRLVAQNRSTSGKSRARCLRDQISSRFVLLFFSLVVSRRTRCGFERLMATREEFEWLVCEIQFG